MGIDGSGICHKFGNNDRRIDDTYLSATFLANLQALSRQIEPEKQAVDFPQHRLYGKVRFLGIRQ